MSELLDSTSGGANDEYLRGVQSSTCLLLSSTPSPSPMDFKHPLSEEMNEGGFIGLNDDDTNNSNSQHLDICNGDSSSSADSNSVVQDPVSAQLINNISMLDYQTLSKNDDFMVQPQDHMANGNGVSAKKLPNFVNWNWVIIRKVLLWVVLSGLVACLATIVAMIVTLPRACNPDLPWYQGKVFYEVFPASFKDTNNDGTGDLKGIIKKLDYIQNLGASAIRLNSIFEADQYPENYFNTTNVFKIDKSIGSITDFQELVEEVHKRDMYLVLDIPVVSLVSPVSPLRQNFTSVLTNSTKYIDITSQAINYWANTKKVDGFYLKNLENLVDSVDFGKSLRAWKHIIGFNKILIAHIDAMNNADGESLNVLLSRIDLIDIHLDFNEGIRKLKKQIDDVISGTLWEAPHYPWVHWNLGNINSERVSNRHVNNTLALTALEFVLPGTVSLFYGDEIGLGGLAVNDIEHDFHEHKFVHNLIPMTFDHSNGDNEKHKNVLSWNSQSSLVPKYHFLEVITELTEMRLNMPTVYLRAIYKEGSVQKNIKIKITDENLVVIERWYPRRNTCVFVGNFQSKSITTDLSLMFYGGLVMAGTNVSLIGQVIYFDHVTFPPNSAIVLKLEK